MCSEATEQPDFYYVAEFQWIFRYFSVSFFLEGGGERERDRMVLIPITVIYILNFNTPRLRLFIFYFSRGTDLS